ncbi:MAG TPA: M28 family peptidase [Pyrinomonadaceae bacterium]|jgi:hypothetical protein
MPYRKSLRSLLALALLAQAAFAQTGAKPPVPDVERLRAHVSYLASDKLEGRRTGTPGAEEAARYIAEEFKRLGLAPGASNVTTFQAGQKSVPAVTPGYFQTFPYVAGVELGGGNALSATRRVTGEGQGAPLAVDFKVGEDWMPLGFGSSGRVEAPAVFVGYGITAAEQGYDDYKGADAAGKVALAFAGTPDGDNPHGRFARAGEPRFKAAAARAAGAKALVLVAAGEKFADDGLSRLRYDNSGGEAGLPVAVVSRQAAAKILGVAGAAGVGELEKRLRERAEAARDPGLARNVVLALTTDVVRKQAAAANVVGVLEGSDPKLKSEAVVVGAHYDHLGLGGEGSLAGREGDVHHGADDNASGTAGLLELARLFSAERGRLRRTLVFVAFGGEEEGLIGSSHYVEHPAFPLGQTAAMVNMDMIGRLRDGALSVGGVGTASELRRLVEETNKGYKVTLDPSLTGGHADGDAAQGEGRPAAPREGKEGSGKEDKKDDKKNDKKGKAETRDVSDTVPRLPRPGEPLPISVDGTNGRHVLTAVPADRFALRLSEDGYGPSDHSSFYARRVPVLFFFTGVHEDYHKPTDTADRINYDGEALVLQFVREVVDRIQSSDKRPTYAVAKSESNSRSTTFRVSLGTVPSYGESSDGLRLDAVREGSPAAAAGLKAGDKIVKLAGRDVRNVYDYTQALSEMKAGQEYEVEVVRDGRRLTMKVTPAARK